MESFPDQNYDINKILFNNFDGLIYILDEELNCEYINQKKHLNELGYSSHLKNMTEFIHFEDKTRFLKFLDKVLNEGKAIDQVRIQSKKGYQFYEIKGSSLNLPSEKVKILLLMHDISEFKESEAIWESKLDLYKEITAKLPEIRYWNLLRSNDSKIDFHETREMLDLVIDNIPQLIYWKDLELKYLGCNINYARINGINDVRFLNGKTDEELIWPKDNLSHIRQCENRVIQNNKSEASIESWIAADKSKVYYEVNRVPLHDLEGNVIGILSTYSDMSDRFKAEKKIKESEKKYRSILENITEGYYEVDLNGNITFFNDAFREITGYSKEALLGKNYAEMTYQENQNRIFESFSNVYKTEQGIQNLELEFFNKDGQTVYVEASVNLRYDSEGAKIGFFGLIKNITEKYLLQRKLIASEKKYRHLFDKSPNAIWLVDSNGKILDVNSTTDKFLSHKFVSKELIGKNFEDILLMFGKSDYYIPFFKEKFQKFLDDVRMKPLDFQITRADGKELWLTLQSSKIKLGDETLIQVLIGDITEKKITNIKLKKSEEALRILNKDLETMVSKRTKELQESEEKFRNIAEQSNLSIAILQDGYLIYTNAALSKMTGYTSEEIKDWPKNEFIQKIHYDDLEMVVEELRKKLDEDSDLSSHYVCRIMTKTNKIKWIELHSKRILYKRRAAIFITFIDITEKREAEEKLIESEKKFRHLFENSPYGIILLDRFGKIVDMNSTISKLFGYNKDQLIGNNYLELIGIYPNETQPAVRDIQYLMGKKNLSDPSVKTRLTKIFKKDKSVAWIQSEISEVSIGGETLFQVLIQDITEKVIAEEKLKDSEKKLREQNIELKELDKLKTDFISIAAHELKTPLISVGGYVDLILMREKEIKSSIKEDLNRVLSNVHRLEDYINKLLDVMKIDAKKMELEVRSEKIGDLIKNSINELHFQINQKKLNIIMDIDENIYLNVDRFRMSQVFSNLITNAIYASKNSGTICIKAFKDKDSINFKIIDHGKGLNKEQIKKLFGKFVALERDLDKFSTFEKGSGLGLYISKGIIEAHGGKIWVESEGLEKGATFNIVFPE